MGEIVEFPGVDAEEEELVAGCAHCDDPFFLLVVSEPLYLRCGNCGAIPEGVTWEFKEGE